MIALGLSFAVTTKAPAEDDSPAELSRRIVELYQQGKYQEAIPLAQKLAGEAVMGLRRGFVEAGAQNLLMTLWPISDEFTIQIMSDFYDAAHQSQNAHEALAKVQRDCLVKLRTEKGLAQAVSLAGPFIMSSQGRP